MNRYYDRLLPLFRQFLLLPNRGNKFMNLQANCSTPTLISSASIWSIPGDYMNTEIFKISCNIIIFGIPCSSTLHSYLSQPRGSKANVDYIFHQQKSTNYSHPFCHMPNTHLASFVDCLTHQTWSARKWIGVRKIFSRSTLLLGQWRC